jgi:hypothetical protein
MAHAAPKWNVRAMEHRAEMPPVTEALVPNAQRRLAVKATGKVPCPRAARAMVGPGLSARMLRAVIVPQETHRVLKANRRVRIPRASIA